MSTPRDGGGGFKPERSAMSGQHVEHSQENILKAAEHHATDALLHAANVRPDLAQQAVRGIEQAEQQQGLKPEQIAANLETITAMFNRISDKLFKQDGPNGTSLMDRMLAADPEHYKTVMDMLGQSDAGKMILHQQSFALNEGHTPADGAQFMQRLKRSTT
jgi:hypothetical protein